MERVSAEEITEEPQAYVFRRAPAEEFKMPWVKTPRGENESAVCGKLANEGPKNCAPDPGSMTPA